MEEKVRYILNKYNQQHLIRFIDILNDDEKQQLFDEILKLDFEKVKSFFNGKNETNGQNIEPIVGTEKESFSSEFVNKCTEIGKKILTSNKYAIVTMAGGQGTRLGHIGPKGTFKLKLKDGEKYIFEIFVDNLKEIYKKYNVYLNWYIMTSNENNLATINFFEEHEYFNYPKEMIHFFTQGELPITDRDGNLVLQNEHKILNAADGNGGVFNALNTSGVINELKENMIEWVLITGVDNILANFADLFFIGLVQQENKLNGVKSVKKEY